MVVYITLLVVALPLMIIEFHKSKTDPIVQMWFIGGMFVLLALPISLWGILQHLVHYTEPALQRHIIRYPSLDLFHYIPLFMKSSVYVPEKSPASYFKVW